MKAATPLLVAAASLAAAAPAHAHHSFASFDLTRLVRVNGVVAEFQWTNPHAWVELDVTRPDGTVERWGVEFNSPNNLTRQGWKRDTLKPGDAVSFVVNPMRDGRPGGFFYEVTKLDTGEIVLTAPRSFDPPEGLDAAAAPAVYDAP
jgi:hypothetical protein